MAKFGAYNIVDKPHVKPFYNDNLYKAYSGSDRDKDGIACEK
ncbi:MAG: excalibur calcium-binding domain-containing protein [Roseiflexaceae bacterium]